MLPAFVASKQMKIRHLTSLVAAFVLHSTATQAANLLQNPNFDSDLSSWTTSGTVSFNSTDGSPVAGSAQVAVTGSSATLSYIRQCMTPIGTAPWNFGANVRVVASSGAPQISVVADFFSGPNCTGTGVNQTANAGGTVGGVQGAFTQYARTLAADPMPGGQPSQSAYLAIFAQANSPSDSITVDADAAHFDSTGNGGVTTNWLQFGFDPSHSGNNPDESIINAANVKQLAPIYSATLSFSTRAAPVFLNGVHTPSGVKDLLFVVSYDGRLVAIDAANGAAVWSRQPQIPPPYTNDAAAPAIDPNHQFVYAYAMDGKVHKFSVADGQEAGSPWPIVSTLKPDVEHGAGALAIGTPATGPSYLYAVTNGYNGDGGDYQGHVTSINLATGAWTVFNANCSNIFTHLIENGTAGVNDCATARSGIWGRPGAVYDRSTNRMYVTTANGNFNANLGGFNWGDSVLALAANGVGDGLGHPIDSYTPTNYADLDNWDIDFGSGSLAILPAPAASKFPHLGAIMGKDSVVRLINLDDLSGNHGPGFVGGELQALSLGGAFDMATPQPSVWVNKHGDGSTWIFEAPYGQLSAFQLTVDALGNPSLQMRWTAYTSGTTSSSIVANDLLFAVGPSGYLNAYDPTTGNVLWSASSAADCCYWGEPILVNGRLYMFGGSSLTVFALESIFKNGFEF